jgi:hypothetical protein
LRPMSAKGSERFNPHRHRALTPLGNYLRGKGVRENDFSMGGVGATAQVVSERSQSTMSVRIEPLATFSGHWSQLAEMATEAARTMDQEVSTVEVK